MASTGTLAVMLKKMNYLEPDSTWELFKLSSQDDFIDKIILKGKFHELVPQKIIEEYKIVERLLFYSYYNYPLLDEAFSKLTRIFESSVTLRLENTGLKRKGFEPLQSKLKRLEKYCSSDLFEQWEDAKKTRNIFAHKEAGVLFGIILISAFKHNLNMINSVFLETETIRKKEFEFSELLKNSEHLQEGYFILSYKNQKILINRIRPFTTGILKCQGQSLWLFMPITGNNIVNKTSDLPKSFILRLENVKIEENELTGFCSTTKDYISVIRTEKKENIDKFYQHEKNISEIEKTNPEITSIYMANLKNSIKMEIANLIYDDW